METVDNQGPAAGRAMTGLELRWSRLRWWCRRYIGRRIPRLVWCGDEVDVTITFKDALRLGDGRTEHSTLLREIEDRLHQLGIGFDGGAGGCGRDWEWDHSLRGPVSVRFRGRARKPERRGSQRTD